MTPDLSAAIAAALLAIAAWLRFEIDRRRQDLHRRELDRRVHDVQAKVGADRRSSDDSVQTERRSDR